MASYTAPTTRASGYLVTAANWNTDIVENIKYLKDAPTFDGAVTASSTLTVANNVGIAATKKLYLDGVAMSGDTYIHEPSANQMELYVGGSRGIMIYSGIVELGSTRDFVVQATKKLYLDSGSDTYITETSADNLSIYVGGSRYLQLTASQSYVQNSDLLIAAAKKFYLDGGGDTYIHEPSANQMELYVGGSRGIVIYSGIVELGSTRDFVVQAAKKLYLDGGSDTYIYQPVDNDVRIITAGVIHQFNSTGFAGVYPTTASAANLYASADGQYVSRSTSSIRYKHDIATLDTADAHAALMAMRPVIYRGKTDEDQRRHVGFIAEEMQQIAPLLCTYDEGGESGTPNYVTYDRVTAYLVAVVQQQQAEINALKARVQ